jgi:hypothetical protein
MGILSSRAGSWPPALACGAAAAAWSHWLLGLLVGACVWNAVLCGVRAWQLRGTWPGRLVPVASGRGLRAHAFRLVQEINLWAAMLSVAAGLSVHAFSPAVGHAAAALVGVRLLGVLAASVTLARRLETLPG